MSWESHACCYYHRAKVTYVNLDVYEGDYNEGKQRHGNGTYTWNSLTPEPEELEEGKLMSCIMQPNLRIRKSDFLLAVRLYR